MAKSQFSAVALGAAMLAAAGALAGCSGREGTSNTAAPASCAGDNGGLTLPPGFCATIFADNIGHARQMAIAEDGTVYVNTWSGPYYSNDQPRVGGFIATLRDTDGDGQADVNERFGPGVADGSTGGTGIMLYKGWLYAEVKDRIVRWKRAPGTLLPTGAPETIVQDLPTTGEHPMHQFIIDKVGNLFVNVGSATNACEIKMGGREPKVLDPCTELETRAGIWKFAADKPGQRFSKEARYVTGVRNIGGMRLDDQDQLFVTQHGRDSLSQNWPALYTPDQGPELPAEELLMIKAGRDYGWPVCYFDGFQKKMVLAPEYGGDGGKAVGVCASKEPPVAFFPGHWAPNDLLFYRGGMFPAAYRNGAFIAFHGSWNRAPHPQAGFRLVFQPMVDGKASGDFLTFADGFTGKARPDKDAYRPSGVAAGPDGALYVTDDTRGRIWRITYQGPLDAAIAAAPAPVYAAEAAKERDVSALPLPPGGTREQLALGAKIFHGEAKGGTCSGCHGVEGAGGGMGSNLTTGKWLWGDGSPAAIAATVRSGVSQPRQGSGAMPPLGGVELDDEDVAAVSAYVWAIGHVGSL